MRLSRVRGFERAGLASFATPGSRLLMMLAGLTSFGFGVMVGGEDRDLGCANRTTRAEAGNRGGADRPMAAVKPVPRTDANSRLAHQQLLQKAKQGRIDVYFVGDSITRRWGASDAQYKDLLANWRKNFFGWNAANFGWGADTTQNILWRLQDGELDHVHPKVIVLLAGTNDIGNEPGDDGVAARVTHGIAAILQTCREKAPDATIILTAIFPRNDNLATIPTINKINENIAKLADGKRVRYLNVNDQLADTEGRLYAGMMNDDQLHPTVKGYQIWAARLKPVLREILGSPAEVDHAPPPTGDPSAAADSSPRESAKARE